MNRQRRNANPIITGGKGYRRVSDDDNVIYHYGDPHNDFAHGIGWDTTIWNMSSGRGTGHYGTGMYAIGGERRSPDRTYRGRDEWEINVTGLKLVTFDGDESADKFHRTAKEINAIVDRIASGEKWDEREYEESGHFAGRKLSRLLDERGAYERLTRRSRIDPETGEVWEYNARLQPRAKQKRYGDTLRKELSGRYSSPAPRLAWELYFQPQDTELRKPDGYKFKSVDEAMDYITPIMVDEINKAARWKALNYSRLRNAPRTRYPHRVTAVTAILQRLGYDGIDTRGTSSDSFDRGSVLFPGWQEKIAPGAVRLIRRGHGRGG